MYAPSTPFDPRRVAKLGRNWSSCGAGAALATGARVASVPLAHAHEGPRGAAGFSMLESEASGAAVPSNSAGFIRPGGLAASLNTPRFNTQVGCITLNSFPGD